MFGAILSAIPAIAGFLKGGGGKKILDVAGAVSPLLGGASKGANDSLQNQTNNTLNYADHNLRAPRTRLGTGARAALGSAGPVSLNWGGPGSGLRGEKVSMSGGYKDALADPRMKQLSDSVMMQTMRDQLAGPLQMPTAGKGGKALGAASLISSLLGGVRTALGGADDERDPAPGITSPRVTSNMRF